MPSRKKLSPLALVALLFFACTIVYGLLSSYPRQLAVYSDELRYLDVARSLLAGRGLRVRNMPSDYQKILYPLCILPALLLKSTAAQITAIGWLNAAYMASAVFPAYALAKTMRMNPHRTVFLVGVTAVLPTMSAASTFMSETVFLPLSLWQVYFFLRAMLAAPRARIGWCAAAGAFCYLLYLNKEVALYYLIAWVLVRAWVWWHDKASWKAELAATAALLGSFLACFLLAKATLFRGLGNSYNQTSWLNAEQWRFLPFATRCLPCWRSGCSRCCCRSAGCTAPARAATPAVPSCRCFCCCPLPSVWRSSPGPSPCGRTCTPPRPGSICGTWSRCSSRCWP